VALVHVDPASALKVGINMVVPEESDTTRLPKEGRTGPGGKTQQPKVLVSISSGIALVSGQCLAALPTQSWEQG
jgi:hypothetical protein